MECRLLIGWRKLKFSFISVKRDSADINTTCSYNMLLTSYDYKLQQNVNKKVKMKYCLLRAQWCSGWLMSGQVPTNARYIENNTVKSWECIFSRPPSEQ